MNDNHSVDDRQTTIRVLLQQRGFKEASSCARVWAAGVAWVTALKQCQNLNKKSEFKRFLAEMSKNKQSRYARKVVKTIHEEGFMVFARKAFRFSRRTVLRRIELKLLSNFYIWGFHRVYYYSSVWTNTSFFGVPVAKCPLDLWIYQEIIFETKPNFIIETGTSKGGSALFFASICELINQGQVITIDIEKQDIPLHPRITRIVGNSVSEEVIQKVEKIVGNQRAMVVLDLAHEKEHVLKEIELYSKFVQKGDYLVVEDIDINGHPVRPEFGLGPMEAVGTFLRKREDFIIDSKREKFMLTSCPKGFPKRIRQ